MYPGKIIKLVRTVEGIAQGELARRLGVTASYLSQVENGKKNPSLAFLKQFSAKFSVPLPLLVLGDVTNSGDQNIFAELHNILVRLLLARRAQLESDSQLPLWQSHD